MLCTFQVIFGGQDTSSYTIAMTLLLLAMHPHIEQRVMDEIESVFGDSPIDADVTMDQVTQLTYLEQTMKEVIINEFVKHIFETNFWIF